jgi:hypothetical protein
MTTMTTRTPSGPVTQGGDPVDQGEAAGGQLREEEIPEAAQMGLECNSTELRWFKEVEIRADEMTRLEVGMRNYDRATRADAEDLGCSVMTTHTRYRDEWEQMRHEMCEENCAEALEEARIRWKIVSQQFQQATDHLEDQTREMADDEIVLVGDREEEDRLGAAGGPRSTGKEYRQGGAMELQGAERVADGFGRGQQRTRGREYGGQENELGEQWPSQPYQEQRSQEVRIGRQATGTKIGPNHQATTTGCNSITPKLNPLAAPYRPPQPFAAQL